MEQRKQQSRVVVACEQRASTCDAINLLRQIERNLFQLHGALVELGQVQHLKRAIQPVQAQARMYESRQARQRTLVRTSRT